jgi:hypothetical protein
MTGRIRGRSEWMFGLGANLPGFQCKIRRFAGFGWA